MHLRDMAELANKHPDVFTEFSNGHFTVQKTKRMFSAIPLDQAHEQNNAYVKGDGGAIGLTDNATALRRWMVAGPQVARLIMEFEDFNMHPRNHEETPSVQNTFARDVRSLVAVLDLFIYIRYIHKCITVSTVPRDWAFGRLYNYNLTIM